MPESRWFAELQSRSEHNQPIEVRMDKGGAHYGVFITPTGSVVAVNREGLSDWPILLDGRIRWDYPERFPQWIKEAAAKALRIRDNIERKWEQWENRHEKATDKVRF